MIIGARNRQAAEQSIKNIKKINADARVDFISLDLSSRSSIDSFVASIGVDSIDFLVNNAGIMGIPERRLNKEGV